LEKDLELPKLTFQVIRRTIATLAQKKGTVKDVQGLLRHSRAATTTDVYMQEIPGERAGNRQRDECWTQSEAGRNSR
jgi:integrase